MSNRTARAAAIICITMLTAGQVYADIAPAPQQNCKPQTYSGTKRREVIHICSTPCPSASNPVIVNCPASPQTTTAGEKKGHESVGWIEILTHNFALLLITLLVAMIVFSDFGRRLLRHITHNAKRIKGGPFEVEFSAATARNVNEAISDDLREFCKAAEIEYERQARAQDLDLLLANATNDIKTLYNRKIDGLRSTVHVPDVVLAGNLYQILDYQPDGQGKGRRLSERYGILGRAWRQRQSMMTGNAFGTSDNDIDHKEQIANLVLNWGMTIQEAQRVTNNRSRQSYLCVILEASNKPVGILYMDARSRNEFVTATDSSAGSTSVDPRISGLPSVVSLGQAVDKAMESLREAGAYISIA